MGIGHRLGYPILPGAVEYATHLTVGGVIRAKAELVDGHIVHLGIHIGDPIQKYRRLVRI